MEAFWYVAAIFIWVALALIAVALLGLLYFVYLWYAAQKDARKDATEMLNDYEFHLVRKGWREKDD